MFKPAPLFAVAAAGVALAFIAPAGSAEAAIAATTVLTPQNGSTNGYTYVELTGDRAPEALQFSQVSLGQQHGVGVTSDGAAYAWGSSNYGSFGNGRSTNSLTPTPISMPDGVGVRQVASGWYHNVAIGTDSRVYAWGAGNDGELGTGGTAHAEVPVAVALPDGITPVQVTADSMHSIVLGSDGALYVFGNNQNGQLGTGDDAPRLTPERVVATDGSGFVQVDTDHDNTAAVTDDGNVFVWGSNTFYQLGREGSGTSSPEPLHTPPAAHFTQVSVGDGYMLALGSDGDLWGWGLNTDHVLAVDTDLYQFPWEVKVVLPPGVTFTEIEAGQGFALALDAQGRLYGWGSNYTGGLGFDSGDTVLSPQLLPVPGDEPVTDMVATYSTLVATADGSAYGWGWGGSGQLGNGTTAFQSLPAPVEKMQPVPVSAAFGGVDALVGGYVDQTLQVYVLPHPAGTVDVTLTWSDGLVETLPDAFSFGYAPTVVLQPEVLVIEGEEGYWLDSYADGDEWPTVQWQRLADDGSWTPVPDGTSELLPVPEPGTYRAVFTNTSGTAISDSVVVGEPGDPGEQPGPPVEKPTPPVERPTPSVEAPVVPPAGIPAAPPVETPAVPALPVPPAPETPRSATEQSTPNTTPDDQAATPVADKSTPRIALAETGIDLPLGELALWSGLLVIGLLALVAVLRRRRRRESA